MINPIDQKLRALNLTLPQLPDQNAPHLAWKCCGDWLYIGGQLPLANGKVVTGRIGDELDFCAGAEAARLCALAVLAQIQMALRGNWTRFHHLVKITVQVDATPGTCDLDALSRKASDLLLSVLGDRGTHVSSVCAVTALPQAAAVQIAATAQVSSSSQPIGLFP